MTDKHPMDDAFKQWWNEVENFATRAERLDGESPEAIARAAFFAAIAASKQEPQACQDTELLRLAREARQRMESRKDEDVDQWAEKLVASVGEPQASSTNAQPAERKPHDQDQASDLYWRLHSLSKALEGSGRIDEHDMPDAYATILCAMTAVRAIEAANGITEPKP